MTLCCNSATTVVPKLSGAQWFLKYWKRNSASQPKIRVKPPGQGFRYARPMTSLVILLSRRRTYRLSKFITQHAIMCNCLKINTYCVSTLFLISNSKHIFQVIMYMITNDKYMFPKAYIYHSLVGYITVQQWLLTRTDKPTLN